MVMPTIEEFIANLRRLKRDCLAQLEAAEAAGDAQLVRMLGKQRAEIDRMMRKKGYDPDA